LNIWNQVEAQFKDLEPYERLKKCREYGIVYYYRKGEAEITKPSPKE
jgi:hypothetical protein